MNYYRSYYIFSYLSSLVSDNLKYRFTNKFEKNLFNSNHYSVKFIIRTLVIVRLLFLSTYPIYEYLTLIFTSNIYFIVNIFFANPHDLFTNLFLSLIQMNFLFRYLSARYTYSFVNVYIDRPLIRRFFSQGLQQTRQRCL